MNVLPPFLKYARRIDKRELIEFIHRRLSSVDNFENGFVENNMFKSILECEANLKEKIVDDFVANLKPNKLDYNLVSQTMKLKTDYLLLVRKLFGYLVHWGMLETEERKVEPKEEQKTEVFEPIPEERKCNLSIKIKHANNIKNPNQDEKAPNTYVCFRNPFKTRDVELRTPVVYRTTLPQWNYEHELVGVSISEI